MRGITGLMDIQSETGRKGEQRRKAWNGSAMLEGAC